MSLREVMPEEDSRVRARLSVSSGMSRSRSRRGCREVSCQREGCRRRRALGRSHCSLICRAIDDELARAQRICQAVGAGSQSAELWTKTVELNDGLTELHQLHSQLRGIALSAGLSAEQWAIEYVGKESRGAC